MTRRVLLFAHGVPRSGEGDVEFTAGARVQVQDTDRGLRAVRAFPDAGLLGRLASGYRMEPFPALLEQLAAETRPGDPPLEARVPPELQTWIQRKAPRTWSALVEHAEVLQRGEAYVLAREQDGLEITRRPEGALRAEALSCPLLDLCDALARDQIPGVSGVVKKSARLEEARRLLRQTLVSRWLQRRLSPGLVWQADTRTYRLRSAPEGPRLAEVAWANEPGVPGTLALEIPGHVQPFEIDVDPHDDLPLAVVRRGIAWLLDPARTAETLFLDETGRRPAERQVT